MDDTLKKYLSEASNFMTDEVISEAKVDKDAAAVVIATEGKKEPTPASVAIKKAQLDKKKKPVIKEEGEEDADALEEEKEPTDEMPIDEEESEDGEICEDEDDGAEDGESCNEEEEGDEMADDDQVEDPKKKKMDIKESYIAHASRWM